MRLDKLPWHFKAGLVAALFLFLVKFALSPLYEWQDETLHRIKILQRAVVQKKALIGNEDKIDKLLEQAASSFEETARLVISDFSDTQSLQLMLQKEMERLSASSGAEINSTDWLYPSEGDIVQAPIKITCTATPEQITKFLSAIEGGQHFLSVDRLKVVSRGKSPTISAEMDVSAYGLKTGS